MLNKLLKSHRYKCITVIGAQLSYQLQPIVVSDNEQSEDDNQLTKLEKKIRNTTKELECETDFI
jgi:hypothetical protein